jgi:CheY-like chemotaxis protein/anti-sigma regulatory factor (Ser/Thr protein kinase)
LLDRARAEATETPNAKGAELGTIIENVTELLAPRAHGKGIAISSYVSSKVPQYLPFRDLHLRQILFNIAGNAIKFTNTGAITIEADVTKANKLTLRVTDTGIGMSQDELARVFQPFVQANADTQNKFGGTGLGLVISQKLVADMKGTLNVTSEPGRGTQFTISLPLPNALTAAPRTAPLVGRSYALVMGCDAPQNHLAQSLKDAGATAEAWTAKGKALAKAIAENRSLTGIICDCASAKTILGHLRKLQKDKKPIPQLWIMMKPEERRLNQGLLKAPATGYLVQPLRRATLVNQLTSRDAETLSRATAGLRKLVAAGQKILPMRILLVDDTPVNAMVATAMLGKAGHSLVPAANGRKALQILEKDRGFDLVLLDLEMPEMDGYATSTAIRKIEAENKFSPLPILALTASSHVGDAARCFAVGMDGYLTKPFERQDLEEALQKLARKKAA